MVHENIFFLVVVYLGCSSYVCWSGAADEDIIVTANEGDFGLRAMRIPLEKTNGRVGVVSTADIELLY